MKKNAQPIGLLTDKQRNEATKEIVNFFATEREEEIGLIAAEDFLDMFLDQIGVVLYNKGVEDARIFTKENLDRITLDMELSLKK